MILSAANGTATLVNSSGSAISTVASGFGQFIGNVFGSLPNFLIWIYVFILSAYVLLTQRKSLVDTCKQNKSEEIEMLHEKCKLCKNTKINI